MDRAKESAFPLPLFFNLNFIYLFDCLLNECTCMSLYTCGGLRTLYGVLCVCMCMYVSVHKWRSEDTLWELTVFFQCEGPGIDLRVSVLVASTFPC